MDTNKMREQFEAAVMTKFPVIRMIRVNRPGSPVDGEYEVPGLEAAWWAWQASREAVVVELPPHEEYRCDTSWEEARQDAYNRALDESRSAIEAQGLKVAP